jgi:hypothetical protein
MLDQPRKRRIVESGERLEVEAILLFRIGHESSDTTETWILIDWQGTTAHRIGLIYCYPRSVFMTPEVKCVVRLG